MFSIIDKFSQTVARDPDHPAILGPGNDQSMSYRELLEVIHKFADQLQKLGVKPSQCVGLHYPSGKNYIIINYAIWQCGACVVPIPVEYTPEEKQRLISEINLEFVISKSLISAPFQSLWIGSPVLLSGLDAKIGVVKSVGSHPTGFLGINAAFLRFTSGTTGNSKGVVLSHESIFERITAANEVLRIGPEDRIIWLLSMSHHFVVSIVAYLQFGATIVLCPDHFGQTILKVTQDFSGTVIYGSPVHFEMMASQPGDSLLPALRLALSTTTSLNPPIAQAFMRRFKRPLGQAYGIIEVGLPFINLVNPPGKEDSVGKLLPSFEIMLENTGNSEGPKPIRVRGKGMFDAYYRPWCTRKEATHDGWFSTGDLGVLDSDGYLYIRGRAKDVINVGGMKVFPNEVETVLNSHPHVRESCVFSHTHEWLGEVPYAHIVLKEDIKQSPTEKELQDFCSLKLSSYKIPERILVVEALVKTSTGKIIRDQKRIKS